MWEPDIKEGGGDIPLTIMFCSRCETIFKRDGDTQKICRPCQKIGREEGYRKRNKRYSKNTIRSITENYRIFK